MSFSFLPPWGTALFDHALVQKPRINPLGQEPQRPPAADPRGLQPSRLDLPVDELDAALRPVRRFLDREPGGGLAQRRSRADLVQVVSDRVLDILVQSRRNRRAAARFFRKLLKSQGCVPRRLITDKLRSYAAARRTMMPSVVHCTDRYANNRVEVSHQPTRQRERQMRRFKSAAHLQLFASVHGVVQNLFRVGRHLLRAVHHRLLRARALVEWDAVTRLLTE